MGGISNTYSLAQAAVLAVKAGTNLLLGPRGLHDAQSMIAGLHQVVVNGDISIDQINASVQLILELKLRYKIISYDKALQLIENIQATRQPLEIVLTNHEPIGEIGRRRKVWYS